ncbi:hypothetical protein [Streptomyces sp. NBC_01803]|uniref:hypothetical protein n=1 Tax=Streptomyces sp. NBC_01803 TaxID=2975946 RepID=UPI002DDAD1A6|nr:hypothetical protein [Streptomyces sp. NBC_01803]WSA46496.1 hypothetical protein OIE51_21315 [Streptomyces sp. NBC_01803]
MTVDEEPEHIFDQVQIGKGIRPLAQHGYVVVEDGVLELLGSRGRVIESAPMSRVRAARVRFTGGKTLAVKVNGTRYTLSPKWGDKAGHLVRPGRPEDVERAADELLGLIAAGGGTVG